jgi:maltooligosyltrehalose synthase
VISWLEENAAPVVGGLVPQSMTPARIPLSTYRLQFNRELTFAQATELVPYLARLGISHCYASPFLRARPGSTHGYDIIDHNKLNPEIGSDEDFERFVEALHSCGMGQILDIVPNHMGVMGSDNAWWLDVLENGSGISEYAEYFDIDWEPLKDELQDKILVPILPDQYGNVLDQGDLKLSFDREKGEFGICYGGNRFPVNPREYPRILGRNLEHLAEQLQSKREQLLEFESLISAFSHLPSRTSTLPEQKTERHARQRDPQAPPGQPVPELPGDRRFYRRQRARHERRTRGVEKLRRAARIDQGAGLSAGQLADRGGRHQLSTLFRYQRLGWVAHGERGRIRGYPPAWCCSC